MPSKHNAGGCRCCCVSCPQYAPTDTWTFLLSGMAGPASGTFSSSTTGNALHDDLNALGTISFTFGTIITSGGVPVLRAGEIEARSGLITHPLASDSWVYTGPNYTINDLTFEVYIRDYCGKVRVADLFINSNFGFIGRFNGALDPPLDPGSENCGSDLIQAQSYGTYALTASGSVTLDPP